MEYNRITTLQGALVFFGLVCAVLVGVIIIVYIVARARGMGWEAVQLPGKGYRPPEA